MVHSRGGVSGGLTISDALHEFESRGFTGQFMIRHGGWIECETCHREFRPENVSLNAMRRIEGASDPADMALVGALTCPNCGSRGTTVVPYGPLASPEYAEVLRSINDHRPSAILNARDDDGSLVSDTGWIERPDDR